LSSIGHTRNSFNSSGLAALRLLSVNFDGHNHNLWWCWLGIRDTIGLGFWLGNRDNLGNDLGRHVIEPSSGDGQGLASLTWAMRAGQWATSKLALLLGQSVLSLRELVQKLRVGFLVDHLIDASQLCPYSGQSHFLVIG
jgi:hypothetical protein